MLFTKGEKSERIFAYRGVILAALEVIHCLALWILFEFMLQEELVATFCPPGADKTSLALFWALGILSSFLILFGYPLDLIFRKQTREAAIVFVYEIIALIVLALLFLIFVSVFSAC